MASRVNLKLPRGNDASRELADAAGLGFHVVWSHSDKPAPSRSSPFRCRETLSCSDNAGSRVRNRMPLLTRSRRFPSPNSLISPDEEA